MTINKLCKSTFVIAILSFLLVAVLAFGGTYAYFSAQSTKITGSVTTGHLRITDIKDGAGSATLTSTSKTVQPNQVIYNNTVVNTTVNSNISYYVRARFTVTVEPKEDAAHVAAETKDAATGNTVTCVDDVSPIEILAIDFVNGGASGTEGKTWQTGKASNATTSGSEVIYYRLAPTIVAQAEGGTDAIATAAQDRTESFTFKIQVNDWVGTTTGSAVGCDYWMDATITVSVVVEVLQADYLNDTDGLQDGTTLVEAAAFTNGEAAETAWNTALGVTKD